MFNFSTVHLATFGLCAQVALAQGPAISPGADKTQRPAPPPPEVKAAAPAALTPKATPAATAAKVTPAATAPKATPAATAPKATPAKTDKPSTDTAVKKPGFFGRVFGKSPKKEVAVATPIPAPKSTPGPRKPTVSVAPAKVNASSAITENADSDKPATEPAKSPETTASHEPSAEKPVEGEPTAVATPGRSKKGGKQPQVAVKKPANQPPDTTDPEVLEKWKYNEAKTKALEDPELQSLKVKADEVTNEDEGRKALKAYNKALFRKMRHLDPSIKERVDLMETALLKRLGE